MTILALRYMRVHGLLDSAHQPITGYGFTSTVSPSRSMGPNVCSQRTIAWDVTSALCLKLSLPKSGSLKLSGRVLKRRAGPRKTARGPCVLSRHRGTTKQRRVAHRMCCRPVVTRLTLVKDMRTTAVMRVE